MGSQRASRTAAAKLLLIICALLLPLGYLSYDRWSHFNSQLKQVENGRQATDLLAAGNSLLIGRDQFDGSLEKLVQSAEQLGLGGELRKALAGATTPDHRRIAEFLRVRAASSALFATSSVSEQSYATALGHDIPSLLLQLRATFAVAAKYGKETSPSSVPVPVVGAAQDMRNRVLSASIASLTMEANPLLRNLRRSLQSAPIDDELARFNDKLLSLERQFQGLGVIVQITPAHQLGPTVKSAFSDAMLRILVSEISDISTFSSERLRNHLTERNSDLIEKLMVTIGSVLGCTLIGLGLAHTMFQSTLRKLDELETSTEVSERSRGESDQMNLRLTEINADIVTLNHELADKMRRLKEAQDELVKKGRMEQLGQLTATVAHEMRNPLGTVRTSAFLLERRIKGKGLGVEQQLMRINSGIKRCDNIITQLLDFSRTRQIDAAEADLDEWLERLIEEEAKRLPTSVSITCNLGLNGLLLPFDPARLERAIINLVNNASEAMVGIGEESSKMTTEHPLITIATVAEENGVLVSVSDNGPGIPKQLIDKVREPLFTTKSFGTGLGLPAVEQIIVQHGGKFDIQSPPGGGATFRIWLPLVSPLQEGEAA